MDYLACKSANRDLNQSEIQQGATRLRSRPVTFGLSITGRCNLNCRHCLGRTKTRENHEMLDGIYQQVVQQLMPTAYVCHLGGGNLGEMTISPRFPSVLRDCRTYQVGVLLTTNGTCIAEQWLSDLVECLTTIGFSMEGMEAEYEKIRGHRWPLFLKNVERVVEARTKASKTFRVEWRYCVHADNVHQLPAMIRQARQIGVDRIQVMNLIPFQRIQRFKTLYYHRSLANDYFAQARAVADELGFEISIPERFSVGSFDGAEQCQGASSTYSAIPLPVCHKPWQHCNVDEFGRLRPCDLHWRPVDTLQRHDFPKAWNGCGFRRLRRKVNTRPSAICIPCRMPRFDGENNLSEMQLRPGLRETVRQFLTWRPTRYEFLPAPSQPVGPA